MKVTPNQNQHFWDCLYSSGALGEAIDWITGHFNPEDIFDELRLEQWALDNGFKKEATNRRYHKGVEG